MTLTPTPPSQKVSPLEAAGALTFTKGLTDIHSCNKPYGAMAHVPGTAGHRDDFHTLRGHLSSIFLPQDKKYLCEGHQLTLLKVKWPLKWAAKLFPLRGPATRRRVWHPGLGWSSMGKCQGGPARFCSTNSCQREAVTITRICTKIHCPTQNTKTQPFDGRLRHITLCKKQATAQKDPVTFILTA